MRQIIRDLADNGEKLVQPDRSRDYEEEFEETESEGNLEIDSQESNEDLQQLKKEMIMNKQEKSKKIIIKPQKKKEIKDKLLKVDRNEFYKEGDAVEHVTAYEGIILDRRISVLDIQKKRNEEILKKIEDEKKKQIAPKPGIADRTSLKKPGLYEDAYVVRSDGRKIKALTYINKE